MPGAGFGVVPTDIAAQLASTLVASPTQLTIAYATKGGASRGTLKTILKDIDKPGIMIVNGKQEYAMPAIRSIQFTVNNKKFKAVYNPWRADLYTAQISAGTDQIETYSVFPRFVVAMMKGRLLWLKNLWLNRLIYFLPEGPTQKQLRKGKTYIKAIIKNADNHTAAVEITGPEAYLFTVECLYQILLELDKRPDLSGALPPSVFGRKNY